MWFMHRDMEGEIPTKSWFTFLTSSVSSVIISFVILIISLCLISESIFCTALWVMMSMVMTLTPASSAAFRARVLRTDIPEDIFFLYSPVNRVESLYWEKSIISFMEAFSSSMFPSFIMRRNLFSIS